MMSLNQIWKHYRRHGYSPSDCREIIRQTIRERMNPPAYEAHERHLSAGRDAANLIARCLKLIRLPRDARPAAEIEAIARDYRQLRSDSTTHLAIRAVRPYADRLLRTCAHCSEPHAGIGPDYSDREYCPSCREQARAGAERMARGNLLTTYRVEITIGDQTRRHVCPPSGIGRVWLAELCRGTELDPNAFELHDDQTYRIGPDRSRLKNYSFKTGPVDSTVDPGALNIGFELEVAFETQQQQRGFARDLHGTFSPKVCCAKSDGSILGNIRPEDVTRAGHGFSGQAEIVSGYGPRNKVEAILLRAMAIAKRHGAKCPSSTGLHLAVGRASLTETTIAKLIVFWSRPENYRELLKFQRREPNTYCRLADEETRQAIRNPDRLCKSTDWIHQMQAGRYAIVSPANRSHIEFRGFGGSMTPKINQARIAIVLELVEYCQTAAQGLDDLLFAPFIEWMKTRGTETAARALKRLEARRPGRERLKGYRWNPEQIPDPLPCLVTEEQAAPILTLDEDDEPIDYPDDEDDEDGSEW